MLYKQGPSPTFKVHPFLVKSIKVSSRQMTKIFCWSFSSLEPLKMTRELTMKMTTENNQFFQMLVWSRPRKLRHCLLMQLNQWNLSQSRTAPTKTMSSKNRKTKINPLNCLPMLFYVILYYGIFFDLFLSWTFLSFLPFWFCYISYNTREHTFGCTSSDTWFWSIWDLRLGKWHMFVQIRSSFDATRQFTDQVTNSENS